MGGLCPLFFDGAICQFEELPLPNDKDGIQKVYRYLESIKGRNTNKSFFNYVLKTVNKLNKTRKHGEGTCTCKKRIW